MCVRFAKEELRAAVCGGFGEAVSVRVFFRLHFNMLH